jgi:hypothetical protein
MKRTTVASAVLLLAALMYWAHPLGTGPLRGALSVGGGHNLQCLPDGGNSRFALGGTNLWNAGNDPIEIKQVGLDRATGVRLGRAYVVGVVDQTLLGSSGGFPPSSARGGDGRLTWMDPRPASGAVIRPSTEDEAHELVVELIRTGHTSDISVDAVKIEYSTGWRRPYWAKSSIRTVIKSKC